MRLREAVLIELQNSVDMGGSGCSVPLRQQGRAISGPSSLLTRDSCPCRHHLILRRLLADIKHESRIAICCTCSGPEVALKSLPVPRLLGCC
jgi:hypothetical protein